MTVLPVARLDDDLFWSKAELNSKVRPVSRGVRAWHLHHISPPRSILQPFPFPLYNPILHIPSRYGDIRGSPLGPKDLEVDQVRRLPGESGFPS